MRPQTPSQTVGPFFHFGLISGSENILVDDQTAGQHITITGRVLDGAGNAVPDALVEIWQPDGHGIFPHPTDPRHGEADPHFRGFGRAATNAEGIFSFKTIKPGRVAWDAQKEQAPHISVRVFARGMLIHASTRLYFSDESDNETDPILKLVLASTEDPERVETLIAQLEPSSDLQTYRYNIVLQGENETVFFDS